MIKIIENLCLTNHIKGCPRLDQLAHQYKNSVNTQIDTLIEKAQL